MEEREIKEQAIVLKTEDVGEADRLVTLLTLNHGKIRAKMRGVKRAKAKLAYASFPFNFGEYLLIRTGRNFTVTNCSYIDNFSEITYDLNKYYAGAGMLEIANMVTREDNDTYALFMLLLKGLKSLSYEKEVCIFAVLSKFMVDVLSYTGFSIGMEGDSNQYKYFNFELGKLTDKQSEDIVELDVIDAQYLEKLIVSDIHDYKSCELCSKSILKLLILFFENKVDEEIKILKKFI